MAPAQSVTAGSDAEPVLFQQLHHTWHSKVDPLRDRHTL